MHVDALDGMHWMGCIGWDGMHWMGWMAGWIVVSDSKKDKDTKNLIT